MQFLAVFFILLKILYFQTFLNIFAIPTNFFNTFKISMERIKRI